MDEIGSLDAVRLRTHVWVAAYRRRAEAQGGFVALSRRGDESAGAIFIEVIHDGGTDLYGPAPMGGGRVFEPLLTGASGLDVLERIEREARFDADLWLVSVEDRQGRHFLEDHEVG